MKKLLTLILVLLTAQTQAQTNLYVNAAASPSGTGTSWATAYDNLTTALNAANSGSGAYNIYVAAGIYKPTFIPTSGIARDATFQIYRNNIKLLGGYNATTGNRDIKNNLTTLSGDIGTIGVTGDNAFHVLTLVNIPTSTTDSVVVEGFLIRDGNADFTSTILLNQNSVATYRVTGGAIYMNQVFPNVVVRSCDFTANNANYGGAIGVDGTVSVSQPSIMNCKFYSNSAYRVAMQSISAGGAFFTNRASCLIINCVFNNNLVSGTGGNPGYGGALYFTGNGGTNKLINCLLVNNQSLQNGGALWAENRPADLINCTIYGNDASWSGDGITFSNSTLGTITNCLIYNHSDGGYSGGTYTTTFLPYGPNPNFINTSDLDGPDNEYGTIDDGLRLQNTSPAKNMGSNSAVSTIPNDITGYPRILQSTVDAGAYESGVFIWNGSTSTAWATTSNWSENIVPTSTDIALIPSTGVTNEPTISTSGVALTGLELQTGRTLTLSGNTLGLMGNLTNNGTILGIALTDALVLNGATIQTIYGIGNIDNLTIANNSTIASGANGLSIYGLLKINSSMSLTTNNNLTLKSTATRTAMHHGAAGANIAGNVTVERFIGIPAAKRAWRLLSPPASNVSIANNWQNDFDGNNLVATPGVGTNITNPTNTNGSDFQSVDFSLKKFNVTTQQLEGVTSINTETVGVFQNAAFLFVRGDRTIGSSGTNTTTLKTVNTLFNSVGYNLSSINANEFYLIGNPYASPIDFNLTTLTGLQKRFYSWDPNLGSLGGYVTVDDADGDGTYTISPSSGTSQTQIIQSGQAFFIQKNSVAGNSQILFPVSSKSTGVINNVFKNTATNETINASLFEVKPNSTPAVIDGVTLIRSTTFSDMIDDMDALKRENITEGFGLESNNQILSIERRGLLSSVQDTIQFHFVKTQLKNYRLTLDISNFISSPNVYLIDAYTQTATTLNTSGSTDYDFTVTSATGSWDAKRFYLVYSLSNPVSVKNTKAKDQSITIFPNPVEHHQLQIKTTNMEAGSFQVSVVNMMGEIVYQTVLATTSMNTTHQISLPKSLAAGMYNLRFVKGNSSFEQQFIIK